MINTRTLLEILPSLSFSFHIMNQFGSTAAVSIIIFPAPAVDSIAFLSTNTSDGFMLVHPTGCSSLFLFYKLVVVIVRWCLLFCLCCNRCDVSSVELEWHGLSPLSSLSKSFKWNLIDQSQSSAFVITVSDRSRDSSSNSPSKEVENSWNKTDLEKVDSSCVVSSSCRINEALRHWDKHMAIMSPVCLKQTATTINQQQVLTVALPETFSPHSAVLLCNLRHFMM